MDKIKLGSQAVNRQLVAVDEQLVINLQTVTMLEFDRVGTAIVSWPNGRTQRLDEKQTAELKKALAYGP